MMRTTSMNTRDGRRYFQYARVSIEEIPGKETMVIRYACKDMGLNCSFVVKGATVEEVTKLALEHVREKHTENFNNIHSAAEIQQMEQALARSTRLVG